MNWVAPIKDQETLKNFGETLKQVDYKDVTGKKEIEVTIGTRNMKNVFTVPEELQQIINEYTKGKDPEAYLILGHSSSNKPVSREQAYRVLRSAGHKIGLNSIGAQTMRKTYAWNYYKETGDIYLVADVLGHKDVNTTKKHYAAIDEDRRRQAANIVKLREV